MNSTLSFKSKPLWLLGLSAIALTGASAYYALSHSSVTTPPSAPPARAAQPVVAALGRLEPAAAVIRIAAPVSLDGDRILELPVTAGSTVTPGQIIAVLDSRNRLQDELQQTEAQLQLAEAKLAQVSQGTPAEVLALRAEITRLQAEQAGTVSAQRAEMQRWQSEARNARVDYHRFQQLYQDGAISASVLDEKRRNLDTAAAQVRQAEAQLGRAKGTVQAQLQTAQANLNRILAVRPIDTRAAQAELTGAKVAVQRAKTQLEQAYIRAPRGGKVLKIHTRPGEKIAEAGIVDLAQTNDMIAIAEVYQNDIGKIRVGQSAQITSPAFTGSLSGKVIEVGLQVNRQNVYSNQPGENLDRRVIEVKIRLTPQASQRVAGLTNLQVQTSILVQ
jgi:HlyD family secretion protein